MMKHTPRTSRLPLLLVTILMVFSGAIVTIHSQFVGDDVPDSFSLCEEEVDGTGGVRDECEASDIRFDLDDTSGSQFGFSVAAGFLNGDNRVDLAVGDPANNKVYIFFGRRSATGSYGLLSDQLERGVSPESQADVVLFRDPAIPGQVAFFGYSLAVSRPQPATGCGDDEEAGALLIGAPGDPSSPPNAPGTVFHLAPGSLCQTPADPPQTQVIDPETLGQKFNGADASQDDLFGYSLAFGTVLAEPGNQDDVLVGATGALNGAGRVTVFPVTDGVVSTASSAVARIIGMEGDGLGEVLATGDLDLDFDEVNDPRGGLDDVAMGAVEAGAGKVFLAQGPLSVTGGDGGNGIFQEGSDTQIRVIAGENEGDFFGFSLAISAQGSLGVGAVLADNVPPNGAEGGDSRSNVLTGSRIHAGKAYVWDPGFLEPGPEIEAASADLVLVARRSGDQLGFAVGFGNLDEDGDDDLIVTARREDGTGLTVNEIDQGTAYIMYTPDSLGSPVDLNLCAINEDCSGVNGIQVMLFGGDRQNDSGDEMGFSLAVGDFNGDNSDDLFISSLAQRRVYLVALEDSDDDREIQGRNIRDEDDDEDGVPDTIDCAPDDPDISTEADEILCNGIDENCNGMDDDQPDADGDGFDACGTDTELDCDDSDASSYPGATELCDGNDNDCSGTVPTEENDSDSDLYVACEDWTDPQGDQPDILGGGDCDPFNASTWPGAAPNDDPDGCFRDLDDDDYGDATPPGGVSGGTDCDDSSDKSFPGAAPLDDLTACMRDADGDGYGDATAPSPIVDGTDCNDNDEISYPGAAELCDGNDNACTGSVPDDERDTDSDGYVVCSDWNDVQGDQVVIKGGSDCAPDDNATHPGAADLEADPTACMTDKDSDDYGDLTPEAGIPAGTDCDDDSPAGPDTYPGAAAIDGPLNCMKDADGDDYGDDTVELPVVAGNDCADDEATRFTGADEIADDGIDQDCNGFDTVTCYVDQDGDGYGVDPSLVPGGDGLPLLSDDGDCDDPGESAFDTDCDDANVAISPGVDEIVGDGVDQDCNGFDAVVCFLDEDGDGFGSSASTPVTAPDGVCNAEDMESTNDTDCDDSDAATYPAAPELCDGNSNACGGQVPVDETDTDGDGYAACDGWSDSQGDQPDILGGGDCAPDAADSYPGAAGNESVPTSCMKDNDGDGYGDLSPPAGVVAGTDCDDDSAFGDATFPGAAPGDNALNCMRDVDGDDFGDSTVALPVVQGTDCDDDSSTIFPGAVELCDGNDNSCQGTVSLDEVDGDGDGYVACMDWNDTQGDQPAVNGGGDCDDTSAVTYSGIAVNESLFAACMRDADGDGYGDLQPQAGVVAGTDCDDSSAAAADTYPGAAAIEAPLNCMKDSDGDDYGDSAVSLPVVAGSDCNDAEPAANPGGLEGPPGDATCSEGIDNDCDGDLDGDDLGCQVAVACPDGDGDGFADCTSNPICDPTGLTCGDCDDSNNAVNPDGTEVCDNLDNNCDGTVDDGFDADGDGFSVCALPLPDCNDGDAQVNPGEQEACADGVDNDCDAATVDLFDADGDGATCQDDCDDGNPALNLADADGDTYSTCAGDCNDNAAGVNPGASEVCSDGIDNDCDAATLDVGDSDGDGASCELDCDDSDPSLNLDDLDSDNFSTCAGDCDDDNASINPSAADICDGIDNDCNGSVDDDFDVDGDGYSTCQLPVADCNDANPSINPGASEVCNDSIDNDCSPATPDLGDADGDGFTCNVDCDDGDGGTYPGAAELCDGNINTCGGLLPADEVDTDSDGYVACNGWNDSQGDDPTIAGGGDCDTGDAETFPGAAPNEGVPNACMRDKDGDDFGDLTPPAGVTVGTDCDDAAADTFKGAAPNDSAVVCMKDSDGDDYGDGAVSLPVVMGTDCADDDGARNPGALEVCGDMVDSDCDGSDPVCPVTTIQTWLDDPTALQWDGGGSGLIEPRFNVYQGDLLTLRTTGSYTQDPGQVDQAARVCDIAGTALQLDAELMVGQPVYFLVTSSDETAGALGTDSRGHLRDNLNACQ